MLGELEVLGELESDEDTDTDAQRDASSVAEACDESVGGGELVIDADHDPVSLLLAHAELLADCDAEFVALPQLELDCDAELVDVSVWLSEADTLPEGVGEGSDDTLAVCEASFELDSLAHADAVALTHALEEADALVEAVSEELALTDTDTVPHALDDTLIDTDAEALDDGLGDVDDDSLRAPVVVGHCDCSLESDAPLDAECVTDPQVLTDGDADVDALTLTDDEPELDPELLGTMLGSVLTTGESDHEVEPDHKTEGESRIDSVVHSDTVAPAAPMLLVARCEPKMEYKGESLTPADVVSVVVRRVEIVCDKDCDAVRRGEADRDAAAEGTVGVPVALSHHDAVVEACSVAEIVTDGVADGEYDALDNALEVANNEGVEASRAGNRPMLNVAR